MFLYIAHRYGQTESPFWQTPYPIRYEIKNPLLQVSKGGFIDYKRGFPCAEDPRSFARTHFGNEPNCILRLYEYKNRRMLCLGVFSKGSFRISN